MLDVVATVVVALVVVVALLFLLFDYHFEQSAAHCAIIIIMIISHCLLTVANSSTARQLAQLGPTDTRTVGQPVDPLRNMSCTRLSSSACQLVRFFMPVFVFVFIICQAKQVSVTPKMTAKGGEGDWSDENLQSKAKPQVMW